MPPQYFERSAGSSVVGSPLTPRRINEVRAESGGLGKGEIFYSRTCCALLTWTELCKGGSCFNASVQLAADTLVKGIAAHRVASEV